MSAPSSNSTETHAPHHPSARGLRVMSVVRWILLALVTLLAGYNVFTMWGPSSSSQGEVRPDRFYCAMPPPVRSPDPGTCPICHMDLEPIADDRRDTQPSQPSSSAPAPQGLSVVTLSADRQQLIGLGTVAVESGRSSSVLRVPAVIEAPQSGMSEVRVRAAGFVEGLTVRETGVTVKRGQPLAYIWSPDIQRAQEELLAANRMASDPAVSAALGKTSDDMLSASRRALVLLGVSNGEIDSVLKNGKPTRTVAVRAPAAGVVTKVLVVLGSRVMPETALYEVSDLTSVWAIANLNEQNLADVEPGAAVQFTPMGRPADVHMAHVDLIEPDLTRSARSARVRITLKNEDNSLKPGQLGEVSFTLPDESALFVPRDAVVDTGADQYVFVAAGEGRFEPRLVKVGRPLGDKIAILKGLQVGEQVVTRGGFLLDSESRLRAALSTPQASATSQPSAAPSSSASAMPVTSPSTPHNHR
ncbi:MAG: efflux RND transporter periplasmic adaptor subunit [Polyangiaceae bacterium]|nr:efflux RND transporter periplasmic adaptor subunit [Polyangiaceae bacterium]